LKQLKPERFHFAMTSRVEPSLRVVPGETFVVETTDNRGKRVRKSTDPIPPPPAVPLSGPVYVEGASKGDTLVVTFQDIQLEKGWGQGWTGQSGRVWGACMSGPPTSLNPILNDPIPDIVKICPIRHGNIYFPLKNGKEVVIPMQAFVGTIGTAPEMEIASTMLGRNGGNMDCADCCPRNELFLPVSVEGAYLYMGDVHAAQGDGELGGPAIEIPAELTITVDLIKGKSISWPRIETPEYIISVGNTRPIDDAVRVASVDLLTRLRDEYHFDLWDASILFNAVGRLVINECTNALYSVSAKFPKKYLE
jgi:amidase